MTHRERWLRHMHFEPVDYIPDEEFGYWDSTLKRWHKEGLPAEIADNGAADFYFGFSPRTGIPINMGLMPGFDYEVIEKGADHMVIRDGTGVVSKIFTDGHESIPQYLDFPLKGRREWEELFKPRLDPTTPGRYPADWDAHVERVNAAEVPVIVQGGSLFGWLRNWAGFEGISYMVYDDPELFEEMVEHVCWFLCTLLERAVKDVKKIDAGSFWEDMCYKAGCIISPRMFHHYLTPRYKRITDLLAEAGCDINYLDCDGNIMDVAEYWLEGGINCMFPVEVGAGTDPLELRRRFGHECLLLGGVDKHALARGRDSIDRELERIREGVLEGGWIPHVDHRLPPHTSLADYNYYLQQKRAMLGAPTPEPWEVRKARAEGRLPDRPGVEHFDEREIEEKRIQEFVDETQDQEGED